MTRRRTQLERAQLPGPPLPEPPAYLSAEELQAWRDIVCAAPDVLRAMDAGFMRTASMLLADWRAGRYSRTFLREIYRWLGQAFIPMRARRRLLFPDRHKRKELS